MSQPIDNSDNSDQNKNRKRATIANVYASTPKNKKIIPIKQCSISLSGIDTASSSSGGRRNLQLQDLIKKRNRLTRGKKIHTSRRLKNSGSGWKAKQEQLIDKSLIEKRKKTLKKRKQILIDTDNEWETDSEKSIHKVRTTVLTNSRGSISNDDERIKLFEDPCTPEKTRQLPNTYEEILHMHESPIIRFSRKRSRLISKENNSKENDCIVQDTLLPVNLLSPEVRNLEKTDEDETIFHENNAKTHVPLRKSVSPTIITLYRNQSVKVYPGKTSRHSTSFSSQSPMKLMNFMSKLPNIPKKTESIPIPSGMVCVSGYWNKTLQKWKTRLKSSSQNKLKNKNEKKTSKKNIKKSTQKQIKDIYDPVDEIDSDFEIGKRISFRKFCCRQKEFKATFSDT